MNSESKKDKIIKIFNKIKYPIEFIISLVFSLLMYKFITVKSYDGYWSRNILIILSINILLLLASIIYNCKIDKSRIENMFLNFAIPIGLLFIVFMLPSYTPDASSHIWKSYEVSNGILFTKIDDEGNSKTDVPEVLSVYRETVLTKYNVYNDLLKLPESMDYNNIVKVDAPSKGYCFVFFIGYAIRIFYCKNICF